MFRRVVWKKLVCTMALVVLLPLSIPQPAHAQGPFTFEGKWKLTFDLSPGPILNYQVEAIRENASLINNGAGVVTRFEDLALPPELRRLYGLTWRNQLDANNNVIGFSLCIELFSTRFGSATTFVVRGKTGTMMMGTAQGIDESTTATAPGFDKNFGYGVAQVPYTLQRLP